MFETLEFCWMKSYFEGRSLLLQNNNNIIINVGFFKFVGSRNHCLQVQDVFWFYLPHITDGIIAMLYDNNI